MNAEGPDDDAPAPPPAAAYANRFEVGYNAFEFLFDFGQEHEGRACLPLRVVTVPAYAKAFSGLLTRSIRDYEAAFGEIEEPGSGGEPP